MPILPFSSVVLRVKGVSKDDCEVLLSSVALLVVWGEV